MPLPSFVSPLGVFQGVDLQCQTNNRAHRTEEMDAEQLVVRRGQPFSLLLQYIDGPPQPPDHQLALVLHLGEHRWLKSITAHAGRTNGLIEQ